MIDTIYVTDDTISRPREGPPGVVERPFKFSHDRLVDRRLRSSEPAGRSALQGFERFMRHVALWEHECRGDVMSVPDRKLRIQFSLTSSIISLDSGEFAYSDYTESRGPRKLSFNSPHR